MKGRKFLSILLTAALSLNVVASVAASDVDISSGDVLQSGNAAAEVQSVDLPLVENEDLNMDDASGDAIADGVEAGDEDDSEFSDIPEDESDTFTDSATADSEFSSEESNSNMFVGGYVPSDLDYNTPVYSENSSGRRSMPKRARSSIPTAYPIESSTIDDIRTYMDANYPGVRNQGSYGTCWAFSSMGLAEFDMIKKGKFTRENDLSELQLAHFTYNFVQDPLGGTIGDTAVYYNSNTDTNYLNRGGNYEMASRRLSQWIGAVNETDVPYSMAQTALDNGLDSSLAYSKDQVHLRNAYEISISDVSAVKENIMVHGAVGVSYLHYSDGSNWLNQSYYDTEDTTGKQGYHSVMIVGWNDDYSKNNFGVGDTPERPSSNGAWLVRNSWGSNNFDYFWMSYETSSLLNTAWVFDFESGNNYDNNYQLDGGIETYYAENMKTVANVFHVGEKEGVSSETLKAVSLSFTHVANVNYTVDIYTNLKSTFYHNEPVNGEKKATVTGTTTYSGIYTIPLGNEVQLKPGTDFSVVVTMDKGAMDYEQATDIMTGDKYIWKRTVNNPGNSFYANGNFYRNYPKNFCIKAFTINSKEISLGEPVGCTLNLDGTIAINMYMDLPESVVSNPNAYMEFTLPNGTISQVAIANAKKDANGNYIFSCRVAAKEMAQDVKAKMVVNGQSGQEYTVSVMWYAQQILEDTTGKYSDTVVSLVKSMLNYGAAAQTVFNYETGNLANSILEDTDKVVPVEGITFESFKSEVTVNANTGIRWYGGSLVLKSDTRIRNYFVLDDSASISDYLFYYNKSESEQQELQPVQRVIDGKTYYYVEISNIKAQDLEKFPEVYVQKQDGSGEKMIDIKKYNAFSYAYDLKNSSNPDANTLAAVYALYQYSNWAKQYVREKSSNV